ncbi:MAG: nicotinamide riboside transporter PnuC [Saprospiraceae bacterium]
MSDFYSNVIQGAQNLHWAEILATIFGFIYIILAIKENVWCWFWGILSCGLWAWATYNLYDYYFDAVLNVFYVVMGFVGIYQWKFGGRDEDELPVTQMTVNQHVIVVLVGLICTFLLGFLLDKYTLAQKTYLDAFTTAFAIFATFMTIQKKIGNWIYWIIVDMIYVYMYWAVGAYLFMLLFIVNTVLAVKGYLNWRKLVVRDIRLT